MTTSIITWLVFGILLALLVGFLVFSWVRDRNKNKKILTKRVELKRATIKASKELAIRIYAMIEMNEKYLSEVNPGFSKVKMKNVTATSRNFLKDIYDSKPFKVLYIESDETDPQYSINLKKLIDTNSNLWEKYCSNEIEYFKKFYKELEGDDKFQEIKDEALKSINEVFEKEVNSNESAE